MYKGSFPHQPQRDIICVSPEACGVPWQLQTISIIDLTRGDSAMTDTILYSRSGHIGRLVLNNPEKHNSLGHEQLEAMQLCLAEVAADEEVRVLIVTGAGEKTFCAGASLGQLGAGEMSDDSFQVTTGHLANLAIPTICALNGNVFGGGVQIVGVTHRVLDEIAFRNTFRGNAYCSWQDDSTLILRSSSTYVIL